MTHIPIYGDAEADNSPVQGIVRPASETEICNQKQHEKNSL